MSALRKILVVDDDPVVGTSYDRVLSNKGYAVITAHNAAEALETLRQQEVDLVVTDIKMPGMGGLELAETVKARRPWTPVMIITGYGDAADEQRARAAGVRVFVHKPLSPQTIEGSAAEALRVVEPVERPQPPSAEATVEAPAETATGWSRAKDVAMFFAAPFIGLVYAVFLPFVGIGVALWMGGRALGRSAVGHRIGGALLTVGKIVLAPFIGLAYIVTLPFAGLVALAWFAGRAAFRNKPAD
ncbi:MAG: response regulator [Rubrivivax sp.]|nr:response regulator [Rubrivivax sp.]